MKFQWAAGVLAAVLLTFSLYIAFVVGKSDLIGTVSVSRDNQPPSGSSSAPDVQAHKNMEKKTLPDDEYLEASCFIGDSICLGLSGYGFLPEEQVLAHVDMGARSIYDFTFPNAKGEGTIDQAVKDLQPEYLYIWLGMNDFRLTTQLEYIENMMTLIQNLRKVSPDSKITVLSISPILASHPWKANDQIDSYNAAMRQAVEQSGIADLYYLDISTALKDEDGALMDDNPPYDAGDGLHLSKRAYPIVLERILDAKMPI